MLKVSRETSRIGLSLRLLFIKTKRPFSYLDFKWCEYDNGFVLHQIMVKIWAYKFWYITSKLIWNGLTLSVLNFRNSSCNTIIDWLIDPWTTEALDGRAVRKISQRHFFQDIKNSLNGVTQICLKPTQKFFQLFLQQIWSLEELKVFAY